MIWLAYKTNLRSLCNWPRNINIFTPLNSHIVQKKAHCLSLACISCNMNYFTFWFTDVEAVNHRSSCGYKHQQNSTSYPHCFVWRTWYCKDKKRQSIVGINKSDYNTCIWLKLSKYESVFCFMSILNETLMQFQILCLSSLLRCLRETKLKAVTSDYRF